ncbi:MAG: DUF1570 domain-containing protein [Planctomycetes bacterium]|nr:DUF1570 domain-containing protein [Planctomycetota bacterium]
MRSSFSNTAVTLAFLCGAPASAYEFQSARYHVTTETSQSDARAVADRMEHMFKAYESLLGPIPLKSGERLRVRLFATPKAYQAYCSKSGFKGDRFRYVHYEPGDQRNEVIGWKIPDPALFMRLQHEGFHQYLRRKIHRPPTWLNEGLAEVFEAALVDSSGRTSWQLSAPMLRRLREGVLKLDRGSLNKKAYKRIEAKVLVSLSKKDWLAQKSTAYCHSWALAHFLFRADKSNRRLLSACLAALKPGGSEAANLDAARLALGDIGDLSERFEAWVKATEVPGGASYARASAAFRKGNYKGAEAELEQALKADPVNPRYRYLRAQSRYSQSKLGPARVDIEIAIAYAPEEAVYYLSLGQIATFRKSWREAKWALEEARAMGLGKRAAKYLAKLPRGTRAQAPKIRGEVATLGSVGASAETPRRPVSPGAPEPRKQPAPSETKALSTGQAVAAKWRNGKWYSAKLVGASGSTFRVHYDDGTKETSVPTSRLRSFAKPGEIAVGDAVLAVWKKAQMWPGRVEAVDERGIKVRWNDGSGTKRVSWGKFFKP